MRRKDAMIQELIFELKKDLNERGFRKFLHR